MSDESERTASNFELVSQIIRLLEPLPDEAKAHILRTTSTWFRLPISNFIDVTDNAKSSTVVPEEIRAYSRLSDDEKFLGRAELTPKQFLAEKDPQTDLERLACLAFYLTHYRNMTQFKTVELSKLNTEAAQRKFANAAVTAQNAMRDGFLVPASKSGFKQLSSLGERFVQALPDREAALNLRRRKPSRPRKKRRSKAVSPSDAKAVFHKAKSRPPKYVPVANTTNASSGD